MNTKTQIALVVIASFMAWVMYQNMVALPESKLAYEKKLQQDKEFNYQLCLNKALSTYENNWNAQCFASNKEEGCLLARYIANDVEESYANEKKNCVTMYK